MDPKLEMYLEGKPLSYTEPINHHKLLDDGGVLIHKRSMPRIAFGNVVGWDWYAFEWDSKGDFNVLRYNPARTIDGGYIEPEHWSRIDDEDVK